MQEDLKKKFILLSRIAKERKYAQEYLGLLARRGDIGSVRIGKRWYTTWEWFEEFLENSKKKKNENVFEVEKVCVVEKSENIFSEIRMNVLQVSRPALVHKTHEEKPVGIRIMERVEQRIQNRASLRNTGGDIRRTGQAVETNERREKELPRKVSVGERNRYAIPYPEIKLKKKDGLFSPNFSADGKSRVSIFPGFAFAVGFAIMLFLIAASGYFIYSGGLLKRGAVAGASDERTGGFSGIRSGGDYYLTGAGDKMKESLSISRVMVETAKEKTVSNQQ